MIKHVPLVLASLLAISTSKAMLGESAKQTEARYGKPFQEKIFNGKQDAWYVQQPFYIHQTYSDSKKSFVCTYSKPGLTESEFNSLIATNVSKPAQLKRIDGGQVAGFQM
jgi:hypothetical protein